MKFQNYSILFFFLMITLILDINHSNGQTKGIGELLLEPKYTCQDFNQVNLNTIITNGAFYVYIKDTSYDFYVGEIKNNETVAPLHIFPPHSVSVPNHLKHGITYHYYFLFPDGSRSNTVESTQDQNGPEPIHVTKLSQSVNGWYNSNNLFFQVDVKDSAGIDSVFVNQIIGTTEKLFHSKGYYAVKDIRAIPPDSIIEKNLQYIVPIQSDGKYTFQFGAKDAAHAAESCSTHWKLNGNRRLSDDGIFENIKVDLTPPNSEIRGLEDTNYTNKNIMTLTIWADDPPAGTQLVESGLNSVTLKYKYRQNPSGLWSDWEQIAVIQKSGTDEITFPFNFTFPDGEGWYQIITSAQDVATNDQLESTYKKVEVVYDLSSPTQDSFQLSDITIAPSQIETIALEHWTNSLRLRAKAAFQDIISGTKEAQITWPPETIVWTLPERGYKPTTCESELNFTQIPGDKNTSCRILDFSGHTSNEIIWEINFDLETPQLTGIELLDLSGVSGVTDSPTIKVKLLPGVEIWNDIYQVALIPETEYNTIEKDSNWTKRDSFFKTYQPGEIPYTFIGALPGNVLNLVCVVRDSAGNISEFQRGSIKYISKVELSNFKLEDNSIDLNELAVLNWINNLDMQFQIDVSDFPGSDAKFEFSFTETFKEIFYWVNYSNTKPEDFYKLTRKNDIILSSSTRDGTLIIWCRLHSNAFGYSDSVSCLIKLDRIPPKFDKYGLQLKDKVTECLVHNSTFPAQLNWTNQREIIGIIGDWYDESSKLNKIHIWGDIEEKWIDNPQQLSQVDLKLTLNKPGQHNNCVPNEIFISARDFAGNWDSIYTNQIVPPEVIYFDSIAPPTLIIDWPEDGNLISKRAKLPVRITAEDSPKRKSLCFLVGWEENLDLIYTDFINNPESGTQYPFNLPLSPGLGKKTVGIGAIDLAGNCTSEQVTFTTIPRDSLTLKMIIYDTDDVDSIYSSIPTVACCLSYTPDEDVDSVFLCQDRTFLKEKSKGFKYNKKILVTIDTTGRGDDLYWLYGKCKTKDSFYSKIDSASIIVDTTPPILNNIILCDRSDLNTQITNHIESIFRFNGDDSVPGKLKSIILWETKNKIDTIAINNKQQKNHDIIITFSTEEGIKTLCAKLLDHAENISNVVCDTIGFYQNKNFNAPNPFNPEVSNTFITVTNPEKEVYIKIYDVFGNLVKGFTWSGTSEQPCTIPWDGKNGNGNPVAEGVYYCVVKNGSKTESFNIGVLRR